MAKKKTRPQTTAVKIKPKPKERTEQQTDNVVKDDDQFQQMNGAESTYFSRA